MSCGPVIVLVVMIPLTFTLPMDNEVYKGCGFDPVPGQPQALKFCTAYGLCIKSYCSPGRVFSRSHCGCVQALYLKPHTSSPTPGTSKPHVKFIGSDFLTTRLPDAEVGIKYDYGAADTFVVNERGHVGNATASSRAPATASRADTAKVNTKNKELLSPMTETATPQPRRERTLTHLKMTSPRESRNNFKIVKNVTAGVNSSNNVTLMGTLAATAGRNSFPSAEILAADMHNTNHEGKIHDLARPDATDLHRLQVDRQHNQQRSPAGGLDSDKRNTDTSAMSYQQTHNKSRIRIGQYFEEGVTQITTTKGYILPTVTAGLAGTTYQQGEMNLLANTAKKSTTENVPNNTTSLSELACGPEISITGMSTDNVLLSNGVLGLDYIGIRDVTSNNGSAYFNGQGFMWMPFSDNNRFTIGITITMTFKENTNIQMPQGLINNCGHDGMPSISVSLHPDIRQIKFKVVLTSIGTPYSMNEIVAGSIPYTPGVLKTLEMQSNGQSLTTRVASYVSGSHLPGSENYEMLPGTKPLYVGKRCPDEETENYHGDISNFALYRCVRG